MRLPILRADTPIIESDSVPMETLQICRKKSRRLSSGLASDPKRAVGGRRTWSKLVTAWSSGFVPGRTGRALDVMPLHICCESLSSTTKGFTPRSSWPTISRANTIATRGMPHRGVDGGIAFQADSLGLCKSKQPLGNNVAVVSRLRASRPCPTSVSVNSPHVLKLSRSSSKFDKSGRVVENELSVPMQRFR